MAIPLLETSPPRAVRRTNSGIDTKVNTKDDLGIQDFISAVGNFGVAKSNKFSVVSLPDLTNSKDRVLASLYCETISIPGKLVNTVPIKIQGKANEYPGEFMYSGNLTMTFLLDSRLQVRRYFEKWFNQVCPNGFETSYSPAIPESYKHDLKVNILEYISVANQLKQDVSQFDAMVKDPIGTLKGAAKDAWGQVSGSFLDSLQGDKSLKTPPNVTPVEMGEYNFVNCYPKSISGTNLSQGSKDFQKIEVVFAFDHMSSYFNYASPEWLASAYAQSTGTGFGLLGKVTDIASGLGDKGNQLGNKVVGLPNLVKKKIG